MNTRWQRIDETTASGKQLFHCSQCGRKSPTCDKTCPRGCGDWTSATKAEAEKVVRAIFAARCQGILGFYAQESSKIISDIADLLVNASQPKPSPPAVEENPISLAATRFLEDLDQSYDDDRSDGETVTEAWLKLFPLGCNQLATPEWLIAAGFRQDGTSWKISNQFISIAVHLGDGIIYIGAFAAENHWSAGTEATVGNVLLFCRAFQIKLKSQ